MPHLSTKLSKLQLQCGLFFKTAVVRPINTSIPQIFRQGNDEKVRWLGLKCRVLLGGSYTKNLCRVAAAEYGQCWCVILAMSRVHAGLKRVDSAVK